MANRRFGPASCIGKALLMDIDIRLLLSMLQNLQVLFMNKASN
jgi:hypothetical protein